MNKSCIISFRFWVCYRKETWWSVRSTRSGPSETPWCDSKVIWDEENKMTYSRFYWYDLDVSEILIWGTCTWISQAMALCSLWFRRNATVLTGFILFFQSRHLISVCVIMQISIFQTFPWSCFVDHLKKNVELLFSGFYLHFVPLNSASCKTELKNLFISGETIKTLSIE